MPCNVVVEGELATVHVTLVRRGPEAGPYAFSEVLEPKEPGQNSEDLRKELEEELTDEARRLLASDDVSVKLSWEAGSLEIAAIIASGKLVADIGAFLTGVRAIRDLFPKLIRDRISARVGPDVTMRDSSLEIGRGLLRGKAEGGTDGSDATSVSPAELAMYAGLSLAVMVVVAVLVIVGVTEFL